MKYSECFWINFRSASYEVFYLGLCNAKDKGKINQAEYNELAARYKELYPERGSNEL